MNRSLGSAGRRIINRSARSALQLAPREVRFALIRSMVECEDEPDPGLVLKIAETQEELEACFSLLHDAYVGSGYMKPDPSGMRVTIYHALPTTTTLCAKLDGKVVGTVSIVREGVFGFPMQSIFDLGSVRGQGGNIAEVSALAVHPDFRKTGGTILFPLMKFLHEYCTRHFDTRHLVIAVNPDRIELYEALLLFQRLRATPIESYDFANGAPAVGASLDLSFFPTRMREVYGHRHPRKNLHHYFCDCALANIHHPTQPYFTTNHPVLTPELMDHFFNHRTRVFDGLDDERRCLLRSIYDLDAYASVLPAVSAEASERFAARHEDRFSLRCPAQMLVDAGQGIDMSVTRLTNDIFEAESPHVLRAATHSKVVIQLGHKVQSVVTATLTNLNPMNMLPAIWHYKFHIDRPDAAWERCAKALRRGQTHADLALAAA
jgi:GNAT superfamily N-acetyltransferase